MIHMLNERRAWYISYENCAAYSVELMRHLGTSFLVGNAIMDTDTFDPQVAYVPKR